MISTFIFVPPFYNFEFMSAGDFPHDYSKPAAPIVMMGGSPILYQVTDFHLPIPIPLGGD
tara:strand:- start:350 stop:529 length:180 start_codon:yes stop_codon:yes gene_type:complete